MSRVRWALLTVSLLGLLAAFLMLLDRLAARPPGPGEAPAAAPGRR